MPDTNGTEDIRQRIDALEHDLTFELQRRERPDRHPYQVGILVGLFVIAVGQLILGLPPESALYNVVDFKTIVALNIPFIVGSVLALAGAALGRNRHLVLSLRLGVYGHMSTFVATLTYSIIVMVAASGGREDLFQFNTKPYWLAGTSVGMGLGVAYASVMRFRQMRKLLKEVLRRANERG